MMHFSQCIIFLVIIFYKDFGYCLKNVKLSIEPPVVERHSESILRCEYDLENEPLYSVKWYRGRHEFYRYTPTERPYTKVFPFAGISVNVNNSNSTQVFLENIEFNLSGNFSCEVTTDTEPILSTAIDTQVMLVVQLPSHPPILTVSQEPLDIGDILRANCSSPPSKPPAILEFILNNLTAYRSDLQSRQEALEYESSELILELPLSEYHFCQGRLILTCIAQVTHLYRVNTTLEVRSVRNPFPERVSAVNSVSSQTTFVLIRLLIFHLMKSVV